MEEGKLAPVVLFVYNRPWHTLQTLEALMANELADKSRLIIYCDGPKPDSSPGQLEKISQVREVIREKKWCGIVEIVESEINKGLAASVISGITEVVNRFGRIIVLEDDLVTSPIFLKYLNEGLEIYEPVKNVYSVNAFMFPVEWEENHTVLLPYTSTWGWATWKERWEIFDPIMPCKEYIKRNKFLTQRFNLADYDYSKMLDFGNNSWGIKWYYSVFRHHGLCLFPTKSLVKNIGFDGSGENCGSNYIKLAFYEEYPKIQPKSILDIEFYSKYLEYFKSKHVDFFKSFRIINYINEVIRKNIK